MPIDITKVKLKKNQTLKIQYKVLSGITWNEGATPKTVIMAITSEMLGKMTATTWLMPWPLILPKELYRLCP